MKNRLGLLLSGCLLITGICLSGCSNLSIPDSKTQNFAKNINCKELVTKIHVKTPGTLDYELNKFKNYGTKLVLSGDLNGADIQALRYMLGQDFNHCDSPGNVDVVDISQARIVKSNEPYFKGDFHKDNQPDTTKLQYTSNDEIGDFMFYSNGDDHDPAIQKFNLKKIDLPQSTVRIGFEAFLCDAHLESISIPETVTDIDTLAFGICISLKNIQLPNNLTKIKDGTFIMNLLLTSVILPEHLDSIEGSAFLKCASLKSLTIPDNVSYIGESAFTESGLESIVIPPKIRSLSNETFSYCDSLKSAVLPEMLDSIKSNVFDGNSSLHSIIIPDNVSYIGYSAFRGSGLESINIPFKIKYISSGLFQECHLLRSVTLPKNLTHIEYDAFKGCTQLQTVHCLNPQPPRLDSNPFDQTPATKVLYVPKGSKQSYENSEWKNSFGSITEE